MAKPMIVGIQEQVVAVLNEAKRPMKLADIRAALPHLPRMNVNWAANSAVTSKRAKRIGTGIFAPLSDETPVIPRIRRVRRRGNGHDVKPSNLTVSQRAAIAVRMLKPAPERLIDARVYLSHAVDDLIERIKAGKLKKFDRAHALMILAYTELES